MKTLLSIMMISGIIGTPIRGMDSEPSPTCPPPAPSSLTPSSPSTPTLAQYLWGKVVHESRKAQVKASDIIFGSDTNVLHELKNNTFHYPATPLSQRIRANHRLDWAVAELIRKKNRVDLKTLVELCENQNITLSSTTSELIKQFIAQEIDFTNQSAQSAVQAQDATKEMLQKTLTSLKNVKKDS